MLGLTARDVHLWRFDLDAGAGDGAHCSAPELAHAASIMCAQKRRRYLRCRSALRQVLARYTGLPAGELALRAGRLGKPELVDGALHFNVSHSEGIALIGVATEALGVDIEWIDRPGLDLDGMARLVCSGRECDWLAGLADDERRAAFFHTWTRKEAYCKALGTGLHMDLRQVCFEQQGASTAAVRDACSAPHFVHRVVTGAHRYVASVCTTRHDSVFALHSGDGGQPDRSLSMPHERRAPPAIAEPNFFSSPSRYSDAIACRPILPHVLPTNPPPEKNHVTFPEQ